jgi:alpha-mannosidase
MQSLAILRRLMVRKAAFLLALVILCSAVRARAQHGRIYIAPDDHTDYVWTGDEEAYRQAILQMTDYYLDLADKTVGESSNFQSRWNLDGSLWMWTWEKNRDQAQIDRLVGRLRDGHFSMPLTFAVSTYGGTPTEAVLRGMYYAGDVERRYGLHFPMAVAMENQTLPRGLGALWAGSGARYSWRGVCACATLLNPTIKEIRPHDIYWWEGPDGSRILMKWNSAYSDNKNIGGYAEARDPFSAVSFIDQNSSFHKAYPYDVIGIFGEGWDDLSTTNDSFVRAAKSLSTPTRQVIVSNEEDFFRDFEAHYGAKLPAFSAAFGNEWDLYSASMAEVSARVRRATEQLRSAEALETLVSLKQPGFPAQFKERRDQAWTSFGLFWEHDWTADSHTLPRTVRADWQRRIAHNITSYVDSLSSASVQALGSLIIRHGEAPRYFVFNPLNWERTDTADLPYVGPEDVHVVDLTTGGAMPSQFADVTNEDGSVRRVLRIWATGIPSVGYKVFEVLPGNSPAFPNPLKASADTLENSAYRVKVTGRGAIVSIVSKEMGGRELAASIDGREINDLGQGPGTLTIKNAGPVSVTLQANANGPVPHTTEITLFRESDRIAIRNEITANFSNVNTWAFSFNLRSPDVWHEEVGAINHARLQPAGDYAAKFSRLDWLTLNHFVTISDADGLGITLSNADDAFMKLGRSKIADGISQLDTSTPQISVLSGGQVDGPTLGIPDQGGDSHFLQRFALRVQRRFDAASSMRFAMEDQNPFVAGSITGGNAYPEARFSLLSTSNPNVVLCALKPAEEGIDKGVTARFWNLTPRPADFVVRLKGGISQAWKTTHLETDPSPEPVTSGALQTQAAPWQMRTFRFQPKSEPAALQHNDAVD